MNLEKTGEAALDLVKNENFQNKSADLLGMLFPYAGIEKKARDLYIEEIENSDLSTETKVTLILNAKKTLKKLKNQGNIAKIAKENAKEGTDFSEKSGVSEEWFDRFMESASFVSSGELQLIWGKILANEFEEPGTTPPNMIRVLSEITPVLAKAFRKICSMRIYIFSLLENEKIETTFQKIFVPYNGHEEMFYEIGISFDTLNELEALGIIKFSTIGGYVLRNINNAKILLCIGDKLKVVNEHRRSEIPIGNVLLTSVGEALQRITEVEEIPNYYEMIQEYLLENNVKLADEHDFQVIVEEDAMRISKKRLQQ